MLIHNREKITSIKKISNISNQFYIDKILNLRKNFTPPNFSALNFLTSLIKSNPKKWVLKPITIPQTLELIRKAKATNSIQIYRIHFHDSHF